MKDENTILSIENLKVYFPIKTGILQRTVGHVKAVDGVSLSVKKGETLGLVGESGCGKSITALSLLRLLNRQGRVESGEVLFKGRNLLSLTEKELDHIRGREIAMVFQDIMYSLNPVFTIGNQMTETLRKHMGMKRAQAWERAVELLEKTGIAQPRAVMRKYPHMLSGGMRQRVMIAMALSCNPELLIADEPTTALDVTIQAQILELLNELKDKLGMAIIFITHDLGVISEMADEVVVMYAGEIVEKAETRQLFDNPKHPYTEGLMASIPDIDQEVDRLQTLEGLVPSLYDMPSGCRFGPRCKYYTEECGKNHSQLTRLSDQREVRCRRYEHE